MAYLCVFSLGSRKCPKDFLAFCLINERSTTKSCSYNLVTLPTKMEHVARISRWRKLGKALHDSGTRVNDRWNWQGPSSLQHKMWGKVFQYSRWKERWLPAWFPHTLFTPWHSLKKLPVAQSKGVNDYLSNLRLLMTWINELLHNS